MTINYFLTLNFIRCDHDNIMLSFCQPTTYNIHIHSNAPSIARRKLINDKPDIQLIHPFTYHSLLYCIVTSSTFPNAFVFPCSIHKTLEHICRICARLWETNSTVVPPSISSIIRL